MNLPIITVNGSAAARGESYGRQAAERIELFHRASALQPVAVDTAPGVRVERMLRPVGRVGLYVPAGSAPLPSTALMLGVPAQIAGCREVVLCSPARADGNKNIRGITPKKGPMEGGKGGVSWIEVTSVVNNPESSPLATQFLQYVQDPTVAHVVAFAEGTFNPVAQMANPDCFKLFTGDELDAIQWDSLEEEMARSVEYDIVPDYDKLLDFAGDMKNKH